MTKYKRPNDERKLVRIRDLHLECTMPRPGVGRVLAMSDCCRRRAMSGVVTSKGMTTWRCEEHRGLSNLGTAAEVVEVTVTRYDVAPELVIEWLDREGGTIDGKKRKKRKKSK